jgi:hypothetical protein
MTDFRTMLSYFQKVANEHKLIKDFFIMDIDEPLQALALRMQYPAMILTTVKGSLLMPNRDNTLDRLSGGFVIIDRLDNLDDFPGEMLIFDNTKQIGIDIISRMLYDKEKCDVLATKAIPGFDPNRVSYEMVERIFDNCFGFLFNFEVIDTRNIEYHAEKWDSEKVILDKYPY